MMDNAQQAASGIEYVASARARNLRITIRPDCSVTVTVPRRVSRHQVEEFVAARRQWIEKHVAKFRQSRPRDLQAPPLSALDLTQAQTELFARLESFARAHALVYRRAGFRMQKSLWGSCSTRGNISLNIHLVRLPRHLQDYVLLHELTHLRHHNHGKAFWGELDRYCAGNAKMLAKELRNYSMLLGDRQL
ncbi:MAG: M48 family metallopeptidase [Planctomycetaceae bacterium]|nr:M48 family metallopeptidase [Planctomycetaceae bacterium]